MAVPCDDIWRGENPPHEYGNAMYEPAKPIGGQTNVDLCVHRFAVYVDMFDPASAYYHRVVTIKKCGSIDFLSGKVERVYCFFHHITEEPSPWYT